MAECYLCGEAEYTEEHHIIPRRYQPIRNETVMLCRECHIKIEDFYRTLLRWVSQHPEVLEDVEDPHGMTDRQREVSNALGEPIDEVLPLLYEEHDGNMTAVLDQINEQLEEDLTRPTLYEWARQIGIKR